VQSGAPVEWGNVIYTGGDLNWSPRNLTNAFNRDRFIREVALQLDRNRRTFGTRYTAYRADGVNNVDLSVIKNIPILTDRGMRLQLRFEAFNAFNRAQFNAPNLSPTDTNFARITSQANLNRAIQMAGRFVF
jgi:hypothetical protein